MIARDEKEAIEWLMGIGAEKVMIQLPDGLKPDSVRIYRYFSSHFRVALSGNPVYGACDIGTQRCGNYDAVVQYGHSPITNIIYPIPVVFIEWRDNSHINPSRILLAPLRERGCKRVGLLSSVQYMNHIPPISRFLENSGFEVLVGRGDRRIFHPGQVLGCNYSAAHSISHLVDCFLLITTGKFHGIGMQLSVKKEVLILDLNTLRIRSIRKEVDDYLKKRYAILSRALDARRFCISVSSKIGQRRDFLVEILKNQLSSLGKEFFVSIDDDATPQNFENSRCDAVIFTGCPRVALDDQESYSMPVMTYAEFQQIFGFKDSGRYIMDEIVAVSSDDPSREVG